MRKISKAFLGLMLAASVLTGCANGDITLNPESSQMSSLSAFSLDPKVEENLTAINQAIDFATETRNTLTNKNLKFMMNGSVAFPELERLILNAKDSIFIEVYLFHNDYTGKKFADALIRKAKEGVEVKLIYDFVGNSDIRLMNYMSKNGVHVQPYNQQAFKNSNVNITHRKIYIIDGETAVIGGMNMGQKYEHEWNDTMTSFQGEAVQETMKEYVYDWLKTGNQASDKMLEVLTKTHTFDEGEKKVPVRIAVTSPNEVGKKDDIKKMMIAAIDSSKEVIKVAMPYFSDDEFIKHLLYAAKRGVKVQAFMPEKSDQKLFDTVSTITSNQLVEGGCEVYRTGHNDKVFSHSKVMVVDNIWSTVGSCNADYRAFHVNQELNAAVSDPEFAQQINKTYFDFQMTNSSKWVFKKVPWYKKPIYSFVEGLDNLI
jgi:cardiolipin synthase